MKREVGNREAILAAKASAVQQLEDGGDWECVWRVFKKNTAYVRNPRFRNQVMTGDQLIRIGAIRTVAQIGRWIADMEVPKERESNYLGRGNK